MSVRDEIEYLEDMVQRLRYELLDERRAHDETRKAHATTREVLQAALVEAHGGGSGVTYGGPTPEQQVGFLSTDLARERDRVRQLEAEHAKTLEILRELMDRSEDFACQCRECHQSYRSCALRVAHDAAKARLKENGVMY